MGPFIEMLQQAVNWVRFFGSSDHSVPINTRIYTVGDIHGRIDLLKKMHQMVQADAGGVPSNTRKIIIYLGDYIDRGHHSKAVIDLLIDTPLVGFESIHLKGNHEDAMLRFMEDHSVGREWFGFGGGATALSYNVRVPNGLISQDQFEVIGRELTNLLPDRHLGFLSNLRLMHEAGNYVFVHAGIRPGRPLHRQVPEDLLWIRDEFHESAGLRGKIIVHGHSLRPEPEIRKHRIGIDTGAYASNVLTCLVLEGTTRRFIKTGDPVP